ncbi:DUF3027 domain-containing protein [Brevibacterium sp. R8603A2]|uniref:DUF3027 domain-containing protein n=1 Tax=Brevibacterium sp. R8603A2 TaxID=2929779 RepID=UPI001FFA0AB1|nr:DUF3027 domain-containing protein [Brevibacterium sp. R8603A2]MCK1801685.1 DUF3027 domain-containing protein [Brevibacterium sp. R8603A2]
MSELFSRWLHDVEPAPAAGSAPAHAAAADRPTARRAARPSPDSLLLEAVDAARSAIAEVADPNHIGAHLGAVMEGQRLATHSFACTAKAYRGWHWVAVLARAPRSKTITVCETALLPGDDALVAPRWLPWEDRLQPGDLSARDTLPKVDDDPNLEAGFEQVPLAEDEDDAVDQLPIFELGLGRRRVLSAQGISHAAERWHDSEAGPDGEFAKRASAQCVTCGYLLPMAGSLRTQFGVCANQWSPFDGRVVALDAGCGAHSETDVERQAPETAQPVIDDLHDTVDVSAGEASAAEASAAEEAPAAEAPAADAPVTEVSTSGASG